MCAGEVCRSGEEDRRQIVGLSGFLTLAFDPMKATVQALKEAGLTDVKIMIGGGQIDENIRQYTGADAYGKDAMAAVALAKAGHRSVIMFVRPDNWNQLSPLEDEKCASTPGRMPRCSLSARKQKRTTKSALTRLRKIYDMEHPDRIIADLQHGRGRICRAPQRGDRQRHGLQP
jgi:cobalamin-dependent methionine synthase I